MKKDREWNYIVILQTIAVLGGSYMKCVLIPAAFAMLGLQPCDHRANGGPVLLWKCRLHPLGEFLACFSVAVIDSVTKGNLGRKGFVVVVLF